MSLGFFLTLFGFQLSKGIVLRKRKLVEKFISARDKKMSSLKMRIRHWQLKRLNIERLIICNFISSLLVF